MQETGNVQGQVLRTSGEPLSKAEVILTRNEPFSQFSYVAISAADGRFHLADVEPGQYRLTVSRNGYVNETGGGEWFGAGLLLTLAPGKQLEGIVVRMALQAAVSGRITDEDGDPVADAPVSLFREVPSPQGTLEGRRLIPVGGQIRSTNDLGDFRIPGLLPGRYFLCANYQQHRPHRRGGMIRRGLQDQSPQDTYPPLYFPGVADEAQAAPIDLVSGQELRGLDLQVRKVRGFRVQGRVELPDGADVRSVHVNLGPHHASPHGWVFGFGGSGGGGAASDRPGTATFDIGGVLPGSYGLVVQCGAAQRSRVAHLRVDVIDRDIEGLVVTFASGFTVEGMVRAVDDSGRLNPNSVHVSLRPEQPGMQTGGGPADPNGAFALYDVPPGRYEVTVHLLGEDGYVKSVKYEDSDVTGAWIEIGPGRAAGKLEVLIAFDGGEVSGTVEDRNGGTLPGAVAHLLMDPPRFGPQKFTRTDQDGRFWFRQVRPGEYWLFVLESVEPGVPLEQRWEQHEGFARKVAVSAHSHYDSLVRLR